MHVALADSAISEFFTPFNWRLHLVILLVTISRKRISTHIHTLALAYTQPIRLLDIFRLRLYLLFILLQQYFDK